MRRSLSVLISLLFFTLVITAQNAVKTTRIQGKLLDNNGVAEISLRLPSREVSIIATAKVGTDGSFLLEFPQPEASIYRLFVSDNNNLLLIIEPGEEVNVTLRAAALNEAPQVSGCRETELYLRASSGLAQYTLKLDSINAQWKQSATASNPDSIQTILREEYMKYDALQKNFLREYIRGNASSLTGLLFIERLDIAEDWDIYELYDKAVFARFPNNPFIRDFHAKVDGERRLAVGNLAPDIVLPNADSIMTSLSGLKGKVVLIDFWAAWCGPCRRENPHVVELYKKYNAKGFEVFGVSLDRDKNAWLKAIKDDGLVWTQVSDLKYWKSEAAKLYNVNAIPHTILIDRDGRIIGKKLRGEALSKKLEEIFGS